LEQQKCIVTGELKTAEERFKKAFPSSTSSSALPFPPKDAQSHEADLKQAEKRLEGALSRYDNALDDNSPNLAE